MSTARLMLFGFLLAFLFFSFPSLVLAQDNYSVAYEKTNPSDGFGYLWKRLSEKFSLFFYSYSSQSKADYYEKLVNKRLAEVKYVIENNRMNDFEKSTIRYSTTVGM